MSSGRHGGRHFLVANDRSSSQLLREGDGPGFLWAVGHTIVQIESMLNPGSLAFLSTSKPIPRWDVHFWSLEDNRKDSTTPHVTFKLQLGGHRQCGLAICTFHLGFSLGTTRPAFDAVQGHAPEAHGRGGGDRVGDRHHQERPAHGQAGRLPGEARRPHHRVHRTGRAPAGDRARAHPRLER